MIKYTFKRRCIFYIASKGQIFLRHTDKEKSKIMQRHLKGESSYQLPKEYGISANTIKTWKSKINHLEKIALRKRGRPTEKELQ